MSDPRKPADTDSDLETGEDSKQNAGRVGGPTNAADALPEEKMKTEKVGEQLSTSNTTGGSDGGGSDGGGRPSGGGGDDDDEIAPIIPGPIQVDLSAALRDSVSKELAHKQEDTRTYLALGLLILLCVVATLSLLLVQFVGLEETTVTEGSKVTKTYTNIRMDAVVQQAQTLIAAVVGLVGSVIGFYFGARSKNGV